MSFSYIEGNPGENPRVIVHGDCDGPRAKELAVFAGRLMAAGSDTPAELDPKLNEDVAIEVIPGTTLTEAQMCMAAAGQHLRSA